MTLFEEQVRLALQQAGNSRATRGNRKGAASLRHFVLSRRG